MKLTTLLASFAAINFVTASPTRTTGHSADPELAPPKAGASILWDPVDAHRNHPHGKLQWEKTCGGALTRAGCRAGLVHRGQGKLIKNGKIMKYVLVEGRRSSSSSEDKTTEKPRKMRVFHDGSIEDLDDWSARDRNMMANAKPQEKSPQRQKALIFWDPVDAYQDRPGKRLLWEQICDEAFSRAGCDGGVIHKGERRVVKPDGTKTSYVNIEAAPSAKPGLEHGKQMRVFQDGSTVDGWSAVDLVNIREGKRSRKPLQSWKSPKAVLSWDPAEAYGNQNRRKWYWEQRCHEALAREGCGAGIIHQGDTKAMRNGVQTSYINVEGAPSVGMPYEKKMRVFRDGSSENVTEAGWSLRDKKHMTEAKRVAALKRPMGSVEASVSTKTSREDTQGNSKRPRIGADGQRRQRTELDLNQAEPNRKLDEPNP